MLTCRQASELVSRSMDLPLPLGQRAALYLHLMLCSLCRRSRAQLLLLRRIVRGYAAMDTPAGPPLSAEARERIRRALRAPDRSRPEPARQKDL
jgi:hypothetical protein